MLDSLNIKMFADGADREGILLAAKDPLIRGFTTNPTLMRAAGVGDYESFAREILELVPDRPFSFEVLSDDFADMRRQALEIASWAENVFVKVPVTNCQGESAATLLRDLAGEGVKLNVTALMTPDQVALSVQALAHSAPGYVSVFAGRIADTGRDPVPVMRKALEILAPYPHLELIWASPREVLNLFQADEIGCHVITMTHDLLRKVHSVGKDLELFSLETVQMFFNDARAAGFAL